jgi:hypothetical protein
MIGLRRGRIYRRRGGRRSLHGRDDEVLQRPRQQSDDARTDTECQRNLQRQRRGNKDDGQYGADEQNGSALVMLGTGRIQNRGLRFGFLIGVGAIGEVIVAEFAAVRNIRRRKVSRAYCVWVDRAGSGILRVGQSIGRRRKQWRVR